MKRFLMAVVVVGVMALLLTSVAQAQSNDKLFIGLWEAVDPSDGSSIKLSLSDNDGDGVLSFLLGDSFFGACLEEGELGRGSIQGTATINTDGNLIVVRTFMCFGTGRVVAENREDTYEVNREDDILVGPNGLIFHHLSTPAKGDDDDD